MTCPPAASFALHRGHRAGVVPALAHVLLVRRVTRVLATVVAAELLARLDLASAPHVLAVHPTSSPAPRWWTPSWPNVVCLPRAVSTSPGSPGRSPRVFTRHFGTDGRARVDAANVPSSAPGPSSLGARAARPGNRRASARPDCLDRRQNAGACQSPSPGTQGSTSISYAGPKPKGSKAPGGTQGGSHISWWSVDLASYDRGVGLYVPIDGRSSPRRCSGRCWKTIGSLIASRSLRRLPEPSEYYVGSHLHMDVVANGVCNNGHRWVIEEGHILLRRIV